MRGFGPALLLMASYTGGPIRYRIVKNEPTPTKIVTPMENKTLASSTCLVSSRRFALSALFVYQNRLSHIVTTARHCDREKAVRSRAIG